MTDENINLVLTNSLCCIGKYAVKVSKLLSIGDKCADSEVIKLKLMNDYFNVALCYNNIVINTNSIISFNTSIGSVFYLSGTSFLGREYHVVINGLKYTFYGDGSSLILTLLILKLTNLNFYISHTQFSTVDKAGTVATIVKFTLTCNVKSMLLLYDPGAETDIISYGELLELGVCTPVTNCLTEIEFEIIINKLMDVCEICPCKLI